MRKLIVYALCGFILLTQGYARADEPILSDLPVRVPYDNEFSRVQAPALAPPAAPRPAPGARSPTRPAPVRPAAPTTTAPAAPAPVGTARPPAPLPPSSLGTPTPAEMAGFASLATQPTAIPPGMFGGPPQGATGFAGLGQSGIPQMIVDLGPGLTIRQAVNLPQPFPPPTPPRPPSPQKASQFTSTVRGLKIAENQSPAPQDRVFFTFDYFSNVNGSLNQRLGAPVSNIRVYRYIFGLEKTFDNGNGSIGVRLPLDQLTSVPATRARFKQVGGTTTALDDMDIYAKYILKRDPITGSLISAGLAITPTTGGGNFAGANYIRYINTTLFQPFVGYIWNRGDFYLQGFSAFEFPVNPSQVTMMYNDVGMGYFLYRLRDPGHFLTAVVPTFEVHVNSPLNHRGFDNPNEIAGTPASVNLTYGLNFELYGNSLLTIGFVSPVTGPRPFDYEWLALFNFRFGRSARRAPPPVISG